MDAIIFDIDGTLADVSHRRHLIAGGKRNWDAFFAAMDKDTPTDVVWLADMLGKMCFERGEFEIFLCSGRPEKYREITEIWLSSHIPYLGALRSGYLIMRADGDYRPDVEVKREMLRGIQGQGYDVRLVVDDRPSVIEMWKAEGLTVLEVDSGEWEGTPNVEPGHLTMMVGPSGAGKSHFIRNTFGATVVVSSDGLRAEITGDLRDQSKNDQVFAALHAIVKARITNGLDTVVDATNLRSKDRRAIRDLVPQNTKISYIVIDRPLEEKLRDAGWRTEVRIPTKDGGAIGLIEKHHQSFQSAAKEILAGDHDPRVRVHNFIKFGSGNMGGTL